MAKRFSLFLLILLLSLAGNATEWNPKQCPRPRWRTHGLVDKKGIRQILDLAYYDGADADPVKHKLDLYLPEDQSNFPVMIFIHGGGWDAGDKRMTLDVYGDLGRRFAKKGVGVVCINYRLAPQFKFPTQIQDVARAFAWVYKNIENYGGDRSRIFVCGHSAGGHLTALLATDQRWLKEQGLSLENIAGAIPISGVFDFTYLEEIRLSDSGRTMLAHLFGENYTSDQLKSASPIYHIETGKLLPPFLVLYGGLDFPTLPGQAKEFAQKLKTTGHEVYLKRYDLRNHYTMIIDIPHPGDRAQMDILEFIRKH